MENFPAGRVKPYDFTKEENKAQRWGPDFPERTQWRDLKLELWFPALTQVLGSGMPTFHSG